MSESAAHPFDLALSLSATAADLWQGHTSDHYWNFSSPYGGITAAILLHAVAMHGSCRGDPLSLTVNYAAPIAPGVFHVRTRLLRASRTTQHWAMELSQATDPAPLVAAMAVFAVRRQSTELAEAAPPKVQAMEQARRARPLSKLRWPDMYDMRYVRGELMQENADSVSYCWIRDAPARQLDFPALSSICDTFFPRLFLRRPRLVPVATVSLNIYFHVDHALIQAQKCDPVLAVARGQIISGGYFDQEGQVWGAGDRLLATTQQIVWFRD